MGSELAEANTLIMLARIDSIRERKGVEYCRKELMGPLRTALGPVLPRNVKAMRRPLEAQNARARELASEILAEHCRACAMCRLGRQ